MKTYLAVYRGLDAATAKLVAVTADPTVVAPFVRRLLESRPSGNPDPVLAALDRGEHDALAEIAKTTEAWL